MKICPEIVAHRENVDFDSSFLDSPILHHKASVQTYESDTNYNSTTFATINTPRLEKYEILDYKKQPK